MNLKELMEQRQIAAAKSQACISEMQDLTRAGQPFGEGEQTRFARLEQGAKSAQEELERIDQAVRQHVKDTPNALESPQGAHFNINRNGDPFDLSDVPEREEVRLAELNSRACSVVEKSSHFLEDDHRESATRVLEQTGGHSAEQVMLTSHPKYRTAWGKLMAGYHHGDLERDEREIVRRVDQIASGFWRDDHQRTVTLANTTGKLVPAHLDPSVVLTNVGSADPFRQLARVVPISTNVWTGVSSAGITVGWSGVDDQVVVGDDSPTFSNPAVTAHMWDAFVPVTFATYEDWFSGENDILMMVTDARDNLHAQSFATGSGTNEPYGIVTALAGTSSQVNMATNSSFTYADLFSAKNALGRRYRKRASWVAEDTYYDRIRQMGTSEGYLYTVSLDSDSPDRVLGKNAYDASGMTSLCNSAATNYSFVYGDFSNYVIAERVGMMAEVVQNLFDTSTGRPKAQRGFLCHGRVGADSINDGAFVLLTNPKATA